MPDRAVVAISEDRQWLVVQSDGDDPRDTPGFDIYRLADVPSVVKGYFSMYWVQDTGQDAHEVLATWMEGRQ